MIWNGQNGKDKILIDSTGKQIPYVKSFNDETKEVELFLKAQSGVGCIVSGGEILVIKVIIPDAKVVRKD